MTTNKQKLSSLDWVEVRSKEEILKTLDEKGQLDGMPFMPEMLKFCGQKFQVYKRAHKTCDTVFPIRGRRVDSAVHLDTRCDGQAHGGCQAGCLLFWKEAWLKHLDCDSPERTTGVCSSVPMTPSSAVDCHESDLWTHTQKADANGEAPVYVCQATQLPYMTSALAWWDIRQYIEDYRSGNAGLWNIFCGLVYATYYNISHAGIGAGPVMRWLYDRFRGLWGGTLFPRHTGRIPEGKPTPAVSLNLQPGEIVRVKAHKEILKTLNTNSMNRGMYFDAEQVPYCEGTYTILKRVTKIINERTGQMQEMKTPCIILDSVFCQGKYSPCRMFCPRGIYSFWREIWLERVPVDSLTTPASADGSAALMVVPNRPVDVLITPGRADRAQQ
jgi:hypothetical protein